MSRTRRRLAVFAVLLAVLFAGGYAVGEQFPVDDRDDSEQHDDMDHATGTTTGHTTGQQIGAAP